MLYKFFLTASISFFLLRGGEKEERHRGKVNPDSPELPAHSLSFPFCTKDKGIFWGCEDGTVLRISVYTWGDAEAESLLCSLSVLKCQRAALSGVACL